MAKFGPEPDLTARCCYTYIYNHKNVYIFTSPSLSLYIPLSLPLPLPPTVKGWLRATRVTSTCHVTQTMFHPSESSSARRWRGRKRKCTKPTPVRCPETEEDPAVSRLRSARNPSGWSPNVGISANTYDIKSSSLVRRLTSKNPRD